MLLNPEGGLLLTQEEAIDRDVGMGIGINMFSHCEVILAADDTELLDKTVSQFMAGLNNVKGAAGAWRTTADPSRFAGEGLPHLEELFCVLMAVREEGYGLV